MSCRKKYEWEIREVSYREWSGCTDWTNYFKVHKLVNQYLFRLNNYQLGFKNKFIFKSTFGLKSKTEVKIELEKLFIACIGAHSEIEV